MRYGLFGRYEVPCDPISMGGAGLGLSALGSVVSANGSLASGDAALEAAQLNSTAAINSSTLTAAAQEQAGEFTKIGDEFEAKQLDQNAANTRAQAQRQSFDIGTQTRLALSTFQARAAGSGLSATGSTPLAITGAIGARGTYLALSEMANGENTARGLEDQAKASRISGDAAEYGGKLAAAGTRYAGQAQAAAATLQGNAAYDASRSAAAGTLASGFGSTMTKAGALYYPTSTRAA